MTTLAELVAQDPDPTHGNPIQIPATSGVWRWVVELADPLMGTDVEWFDITGFYASDRYQRGAAEYLGRARAAVAQVHLHINRTIADDLGVPLDILAPWGLDTTALFGVDITLDAGLLMRAGAMRVVSGSVVEWFPAWTGRVETWGDAASALGELRDHTITVVDLMGDLVNVPTQTETDAWENWIGSVLTQADWPYGHDIYGDTGTPSLPSRDSEQPSAVNELDAACDPLALVWRTLRSGRLVVHPAPFDELHTNRYPNPLLDHYPSGLVFSYNPNFTEIAYATGDNQNEPPGVQRTSLGIINALSITMPGGPYPIDNPTSISKYGRRPQSASWIIDNEPAADQLLDKRSNASVQVSPLLTTIDLEGFWPAMGLVHEFDPVTFVHATHESAPVVTATGWVRNVTELREVRHDNALSWETIVVIDAESTAVDEALLPVENLQTTSVQENLAVATWDNPVQPNVTPTGVQFRVIGQSTIWLDIDYDGVGSQMVALFALEPSTSYTLQVRLVRQVNGLITHASIPRSVNFTTLEFTEPPFIEDDDGTTTEVPPVDEGCEIELELQENDGTGWVTIETWEQDDLVFGEDGLWHPDEPFTDQEPDKIYRFRWREICDGTPGDWIVGEEGEIPPDWEEPCITPPALSEAPFDDEDLLVYVPKICHGNVVTEAVSGIAGVHGGAWAGLVQMLGEPDRIGLRSIAQPGWGDAPGGIIAYGECPQINGVTGSKTITAKAYIHDPEFCVLNEMHALRITCTPSGSGWKAGAVVFTADGTGSCLSSELTVDTEYVVQATYDADTGDLTLYVDEIPDGSTSFGEARDTINSLPIWRVGAPPESWVTDCALFDGVRTPGSKLAAAILALNPLGYWKLDEPSPTSGVTTATDSSGNGRHGAYSGAGTGAGTFAQQAGPDGINYADFGNGSTPGGTAVTIADNNVWSINAAPGLTVFALIKPDSVAGTTRQFIISKGSNTNQFEWELDINVGSAGRLTYIVQGNTGNSLQREDVNSVVTTGWQAVAFRTPDVAFNTRGDLYRNSATPLASTQGSVNNTNAYANGTAQVWIGYRQDSPADQCFKGAIAHVAIFAGEVDLTSVFDAAAADGWI